MVTELGMYNLIKEKRGVVELSLCAYLTLPILFSIDLIADFLSLFNKICT